MNKKDQCLKLIQLYGEYRRLWDAQCPDYTNRGLREDAWKNISRKMNIPIADLKKKMDYLLGSYRREKSRDNKKPNHRIGYLLFSLLLWLKTFIVIISKLRQVFK
jgi:hypothetical protein